jgi:pSer/pThr/pTyr-binding forkhead associated (FHA) protein
MTHHPSLEWPEESSNELREYDVGVEWLADSAIANPSTSTYLSGSVNLASGQPLIRLLVEQTSIIPSYQTHVLCSGYHEVQIGRDLALPGTNNPRIRLKELAVSKVHATVYWDEERKRWCIVDMGSMHGTFIRGVNEKGAGLRLSGPRIASIPRALHHLDRVNIGSTTFVVHVHGDGMPCAECSPSSAECEIPLFPTQNKKHSRGVHSLRHVMTKNAQADPKKALTVLKRSLLTQPGANSHRPSAASDRSRYIDRSARRRALHAGSYSDSPGVRTPNTPTGSSLSLSQQPETEAIVSQPPAPLPSSNIGHRLLMKQGWEPGTSLGVPDGDASGRVCLVDPLEVSIPTRRAGLGMLNKRISVPEMRDVAKQRRWDDISLHPADSEG